MIILSTEEHSPRITCTYSEKWYSLKTHKLCRFLCRFQMQNWRSAHQQIQGSCQLNTICVLRYSGSGNHESCLWYFTSMNNTALPLLHTSCRTLSLKSYVFALLCGTTSLNKMFAMSITSICTVFILSEKHITNYESKCVLSIFLTITEFLQFECVFGSKVVAMGSKSWVLRMVPIAREIRRVAC